MSWIWWAIVIIMGANVALVIVAGLWIAHKALREDEPDEKRRAG